MGGSSLLRMANIHGELKDKQSVGLIPDLLESSEFPTMMMTSRFEFITNGDRKPLYGLKRSFKFQSSTHIALALSLLYTRKRLSCRYRPFLDCNDWRTWEHFWENGAGSVAGVTSVDHL